MAIAVDSVTTQTGVGSTLSWSHTVSGANRFLDVVVEIGNAGVTVSSIQYGLTAPTLVRGRTHTNLIPRVEVWKLVDPPVGTDTILVTLSGAVPNGAIAGAISYTGVDQATPIDGDVDAEGTGTTASLNVTSAAGDLVQDGACCPSSASGLTVGAGQTERWNLAAGVTLGAGSTEPGAGTVTMSWGLALSADWVIVGFNLNAALDDLATKEVRIPVEVLKITGG